MSRIFANAKSFVFHGYTLNLPILREVSYFYTVMKIQFFSPSGYRDAFYPFCEIRTLLELRLGILTLHEKWAYAIKEAGMESEISLLPKKEKKIASSVEKELLVVEHAIPTKHLINQLFLLKEGEALYSGKHVVAVAKKDFDNSNNLQHVESTEHFLLHSSLDVLKQNTQAINSDFQWLTKGRISQSLHSSNTIIGPPQKLFVEEGAQAYGSSFNTLKGHIYIAAGATIMEGSHIQGPVSIGPGSLVKMGACIYGGTTIGPYCLAGGEIKNSILHSFSNKAHHGYLGDSIIGSWCNMGAGTSNSNLKNDVGDISLELPAATLSAGIKMGMLLGDYSRTAINTSINTGTVIGISCNVFGNGLTPKNIPSFSWGYSPVEKYDFNKAIKAIEKWKNLKDHTLEENEIAMLQRIFAAQF